MAGTAFCELRSLTSVVTGKNQGCIFFQYCLLAVSFPLLFPSRLSFTAAKRTERLRIRFRIPARQSTSRRCLMGSGSQRSTGRAGGRRSTCCYGTWGHGWTSGSARTLLVLQEGRDTQHRRGFSGSLVRRSIQQGAGHCFFSMGLGARTTRGAREPSLSLPSSSGQATWICKRRQKIWDGERRTQARCFSTLVVFSPRSPCRRRHVNASCHSCGMGSIQARPVMGRAAGRAQVRPGLASDVWGRQEGEFCLCLSLEVSKYPDQA